MLRAILLAHLLLPQQSLRKRVSSTPPCPEVSLSEMQVVDERGRPVEGVELYTGEFLKSDAQGRIHIPAHTRSCSASISSEGWKRVTFDAQHLPARVVVVPAVALDVWLRSGVRQCPKPTIRFEPPALETEPPRLGPGSINFSELRPGKGRAFVGCGIPGLGEQPIDLDLRQGKLSRFDLEFDDPTLRDPANHFELSGRFKSSQPGKPTSPPRVTLTVRCREVVRAGVIQADGTFRVTGLPEYPRCALEVLDGPSGPIAEKAVVPVPSTGVELTLRSW
jgi:hypothetical protein